MHADTLLSFSGDSAGPSCRRSCSGDGRRVKITVDPRVSANPGRACGRLRVVTSRIIPSRENLDLPLDVRGTAFQQRVWQSLRNIPAGSTASYTDVAKLIDSPNSVRAVAQACGTNTLAVAIPCHRVVRNDGALSGYRWGVERKRMLLKKEADA